MLNIKERNPDQLLTSVSQCEIIYFSLKPKKTKLEHQEENQTCKSVKLAEETINQISNLQSKTYSELFPVHITNLKMLANCLPVPFLFLHTTDPKDNDV